MRKSDVPNAVEMCVGVVAALAAEEAPDAVDGLNNELVVDGLFPDPPLLLPPMLGFEDRFPPPRPVKGPPPALPPCWFPPP
jgi:hypothetical protein